jgi:AcrR family transcriptional regulator
VKDAIESATTRGRSGARQRRAPAVRRRMITRTALGLFAQRGYRSVTIRDIAAACDINLALIYHYFANKEDLFRASIEAAIQEMLDRYQALRDRVRDPVELLDGWFKINIEQFEPLMMFVKVTVDRSYSSALSEKIDRLIEQLYAREIEILRDCIRRGIDGGKFVPVDPDAMALFISVHLDGIFLAAMNRPGTRIEPLVDNLRTIVWQQLGYQSTAADT